MKLKSFALILGLCSFSVAQAAPKTNLCDTIDAASVDLIKACQEKYGVSKSYK